jgi:hypothetical protein
MHRNRRTTVIVAGGALAVASVSYGLGTQTGDGTAAAGSGDRAGGAGVAFERCAPPGFSNLADELGVDAGELRDALLEFHEREHADRRHEFASALAEALGISAERVSAALDELHEKLEARMERRGDRIVPAPAPGAHGGPHVRLLLPIRQLASALDVSRADLREALREVRPDGLAFERHRQARAEFLAERFDLDVDQVTDALGDLPRPAPPPPGGRPGPGGPGAFGPAR